MAWIESHQELKNHPKTLLLCDLLRATRPHVLGCLHLLWWWCLDYALDGDLSKFTEKQIAKAAEWQGNARRFVTALQRSGFLDDRKVHDWHEFTLHYNLSIEKRERQREQVRERVKRWRNTHVTQGNADVTPSNAPTVPDLTVPNPTKPKKKGSAFLKPSAEEVTAYGAHLGYKLNAQEFVDHYESNGWKVGKNPMRNWKAAVRTWINRHAEFNNGNPVPRIPPPPKPVVPEREPTDAERAEAKEVFGKVLSTLGKGKAVPQ